MRGIQQLLKWCQVCCIVGCQANGVVWSCPLCCMMVMLCRQVRNFATCSSDDLTIHRYHTNLKTSNPQIPIQVQCHHAGCKPGIPCCNQSGSGHLHTRYMGGFYILLNTVSDAYRQATMQSNSFTVSDVYSQYKILQGYANIGNSDVAAKHHRLFGRSPFCAGVVLNPWVCIPCVLGAM